MRNVIYSGAVLACVTIFSLSAVAQGTTYAEKLGFPKGTRALILHIDDAGMSLDSDRGVDKAITQGVANSLSVMMPCPWVPHMVKWLKAHPGADAGLHLTLTSEWSNYRWGPLAGKPAVPGLVDSEGCMYESVAGVVKNATADEVETEIRAQLDRARTMGFEPTHMDSHMGTLFATDAFLERYIKVGIEEQIPVMFPGGHNFFALQEYGDKQAGGKARMVGQMMWKAGLPVLDDLHNTSYEWKTTDKTDKYVKAVKGLKPGVTMMIMHCTDPSEIFDDISGSGTTRLGDMKAMMDPRLRKAIEDEGIVLTTWRELKERRDKAGK
jgi:YdjC-like protein